MTTEQRKLEVGDKVYRLDQNTITSIYPIERVTNAQAISGLMKFKRRVDEYGYVYDIGGSRGRWISCRFKIENEELKQQVLRQNTLNKIRDVKFDAFKTENLVKILHSINMIDNDNTPPAKEKTKENPE